MTRTWRSLALLGLAVVAMGCGRSSSPTADSVALVSGETSAPGNQLAYAHTVQIQLAEPADIAPRIDAVRAACADARFGACSVLGLDVGDETRVHGQLRVRIVPEGVEPLVGLAAQQARVGHRSTQAEDLAGSVADVTRRRATAVRQLDGLSALQDRDDLAVSDRIALVREIGQLEVQIEEIEAAAAGFQRRIETNLLTLDFATTGSYGRGNRIGAAFDGLVEGFVDGVEGALRLFGQSVPFLVLLFPLILLWRWAWRRATRRGAPRGES